MGRYLLTADNAVHGLGEDVRNALRDGVLQSDSARLLVLWVSDCCLRLRKLGRAICIPIVLVVINRLH